MEIPFFEQLMLFVTGGAVGGLVGMLIGAQLMTRANEALSGKGQPLTVGRVDLP